MKKRNRTLFVGAAVLLLAGPVMAQVGTVHADSISEAQSAISSNQAKKEKLIAQMNELQSKVWSLDKKVVAKNQAIAKVTDDIAASQTRLDQIAGEITVTTKELKNRRTILKNQLIELQKQSSNSVSGNVYVDFVLSSDGFTELLSRSFAVSKLNKANQEAMAAVQESENKLKDLKQEQDAKQQALVASKAQLVNDKADLVTAQKAANVAVNNLQAEVTANQDLLENLQVTLKSAVSTAAQEKANAAAAAAAETARKAAVKASTVTTSTNSSTGSTSNSGSNNVGSGSSSTASGTPNVTHTSNNPYAWGQCTWYAYARSGWAGGSWGNGADWGNSARAAGFTVNHTPAAGAIVSFAAGQSVGGQWTADGQYGHVAYVESYNAAAGTITISQGGMGFSSPGGPNLQTISNVGAYTYVHSPY
ncbi:CHAP domain-containing protein [Lapidilactobacillus luobeiensis]|uniref:CHAP domain-containing protein n=1 Tax=Lapidilactobacillus luobeiensis TaxID=2950371 RepID=UPI002852A9E0|nr:CHAP domain-containing protein [Lapidilactobacillus luobeiensis]